MKRILLVLFGAAVALMFSAPAYATETTTSTVHVVSSPDDGNPPWARDTFDRKTTVTKTETGWLIEFTDEGTFTTTGEEPITGTLKGQGTFVVTGGTLRTELPSGTIDRSDKDVKDDFTTGWWSKFITGEAAETAGISKWKWVYKTCLETRTESESGGVEGDYPTKFCPPPTKSPQTDESTSPKPKPSHSLPAPSTSTPAGGPVAGGAGSGGSSLPVTGVPAGPILAAGAAVLLGGAGLLWAARRRRTRFTA